MEMFCPKIKFKFCFRIDKLVDKAIFNFYSYNKINDFVATQYSNKYIIHFISTRILDQMRMGWEKCNSVGKQKLLTEKIFGR